MNKKKVVEEFESMIHLAEIRALSSFSSEHSLSDAQFKRMMELKNKIFVR